MPSHSQFRRNHSATAMLFRPLSADVSSKGKLNEVDEDYKPRSLNLKGPAMVNLLMKLGYQVPKNGTKQPDEQHEFLDILRALLHMWKANGKFSYLAFEGLLFLLELSFTQSQCAPALFQCFITQTGAEDFIRLAKEALPVMIDSDMVHGSNYVDMLLTNLALNLANTGNNLLAQFITAVPYFSGHYLCVHTKRFEELFTNIHTQETRIYDENTHETQVILQPHYLSCMHFPERKIIVSNAPPVKLRKRSVVCREKFTCDVSAGGLVSGLKPSLGNKDVWVSYLDTALMGLDKLPQDLVPKLLRENVRIPGRYRRSTSLSRHSSGGSSGSNDDDAFGIGMLEDFLWEKAEQDFLSLQKRLDWFAEHHFAVNPLVILKDDHKPFYNGISNGLFWPAFHNLPQYIINEYKGEDRTKLNDDWIKYVKVNFYFAIHTARTCRTQDFLWIHDYHLFLVGLILRSLDPSISAAFFLHIPFALTDQFLRDYSVQGKAVLRGLLGFKRVGFQTSNDTRRFVDLATRYIPGVREISRRKLTENLVFTLDYNGWLCDVGTFPISVKPMQLIRLAKSEIAHERSQSYRQQIMQGRSGKIFLSVERFDYTKGIVERLRAIQLYFRMHPEAVGHDVFYQVACQSRGDVSSYSAYHQQARDLVDQINQEFGGKEEKSSQVRPWQPVIIDQVNHPQDEVVFLYKCSDVIVVTPVADGMNLVIKEAMLCNPQAVYVLSSGAGAEQQLFDAGLQDRYLRVGDIEDTEQFAELLHRAALTPADTAAANGAILKDYTAKHDVEHWMTSFTDSQWTHDVIPRQTISNEMELAQLLWRVQDVRHMAVKYLLTTRHMTPVFNISLHNAFKSISTKEFLSQPMALGLEGVVEGLKQDVAFLGTFIEHKKTADVLMALVPHQLDNFHLDAAKLVAFLERVEHVDICLTSAESLTCGAGGPKALRLQNATCGLLFSRFTARYASSTIVVSDKAEKQLKEALSTPADWVILGPMGGRQWLWGTDHVLHGHNQSDLIDNLSHIEQYLKLSKEYDKMLVLCTSEADMSLVKWAVATRKKTFVIYIGCCANQVNELGRLVKSKRLCVINDYETLCYAMAVKITKNVTIGNPTGRRRSSIQILRV